MSESRGPHGKRTELSTHSGGVHCPLLTDGCPLPGNPTVGGAGPSPAVSPPPSDKRSEWRGPQQQSLGLCWDRESRDKPSQRATGTSVLLGTLPSAMEHNSSPAWCPWRSPFLSRALRLLIWKMRLLDCPPPVPSGLEPWALLVLCSAPTRLSWSLCSMRTGASPLDSPRCCGSSGENLPSSCSDTKHATWFSPDAEEDSH